MTRSEGLGGSFSVDGENIEVDLAEFGWDRPITGAGSGAAGGEGGDSAHDDDGRVRLQKALAHAGVASRRACETLITSGRVTVNGVEERELGSRVDPDTDEVRVDGVVVQLDVSKRYFVLNKPTGVVSTMSDENGRPDLREFADQVEDRLYNVGRLDEDTSGLLILTNDGDLAHRLAHPSFGVQKTYIAKVRGRVTAAVIQQLKDGVELKDGRMHADRAKLLPNGTGTAHSLVELTLHSGRNRIVRRMLAEVGHPVVELVRRQFGPLHLGTLRSGELRELAPAERGALLSAVADGGASGDSAEGGAGSQSADTRGRAGGASSDAGKPAKKRREVTAGRPGDGAGARGMRGTAARGNPHGRGGPKGDGARGASGADRAGGRGRSSDGNGGSGGFDGFSGRGGSGGPKQQNNGRAPQRGGSQGQQRGGSNGPRGGRKQGGR